ncbi:MAG TPA: hypothetical protein VKY85_01075 [Candidatus Angelobacter sp.]|nr:hypothetical protein [Candidatus Angelobacter sp.]
MAHHIRYFSKNRIQIKERYYFDDERYFQTEFDEATGLITSEKQFNRTGELQSYFVRSYDSNGDVSRSDMYDGGGRWFGRDDYKDDLRTARSYKFYDGSSKEIRYSYDEKRSLKESQIYVNNKFVCSLVYDVFPNGVIKRTLAQSPDGDLWGEYPGLVFEVERTGWPVGSMAGTLYKKDNWW